MVGEWGRGEEGAQNEGGIALQTGNMQNQRAAARLAGNRGILMGNGVCWRRGGEG